jgi:RecB family exonuclease
MHAALQEFHEQGGTETQPVEQLLQKLETSWVGAGYASPEEQAARMDQGQQMLAGYYQAEEERPAETLFLERMLSLPQDDFVLVGRVDRVDRRPDGMLEVVDYKSGSYLPTTEELQEDLAVGIYQLLTGRALDAVPIMGTIYNLRSNETVSIVRDEPGLQQVQAHVQDVFHVLNNDTRFDPQPGRHCVYCDYASYCPAALWDPT